MATLVLGTVGRALGGPLGGLAGTFLGGALDRGLFGGGRSREGPRLANLAVQSAAYGEALPRLYGRMRVAGNLVWTAGIRETRSRSGGGKRGPATSSYSYSASFAIIVSARAIDCVERIWADGKLLRASDGGLIYPAIIRTYRGSEDQTADPLIAAAEGLGSAPAYRGRAYVVFEDLALADFGNRIPNLTFEVVADPGTTVGVDTIAADLGDGIFTVEHSVSQAAVGGFAAARGGSLRRTLEQLSDLTDLSFAAGPDLVLCSAGGPATTLVAGADQGAAGGSLRHETRAAAATVPDALVIGFSDPARDFQAGLQRAVRRTPVVRSEQRDLAAALDASAAKRFAETLLRRAVAARTVATVALPWRHAAISAGDIIGVAPDAEPWRVRRWTMTGAVIELELARLASATTAALPATDPGRVYDAGDAPAGPTTLHVLDLPPLAGPLPTTPRLWFAAAGSGSAWRRTEVVVSVDGGASYAAAATIDGPTTMGTADGALAAGVTDRWDRRSALDVTVLSDAMWLESRSEASVLAGANAALIGDEIVQFASVAALDSRRYRLTNFLRGRRGTESAIAGHIAGERFVVLDPARLGLLDLPPETIGATLDFKALGAGDDIAATPSTRLTLAGRALQPLSPVFLRAAASPGGWMFGWTRRSRAGFGWADGADAPLGEESERYRLVVHLDGVEARAVDLATAAWTYPPVLFAGDGGGSASWLEIAVAQVGAVAGAAASLRIDLANS